MHGLFFTKEAYSISVPNQSQATAETNGNSLQKKGS